MIRYSKISLLILALFMASAVGAEPLAQVVGADAALLTLVRGEYGTLFPDGAEAAADAPVLALDAFGSYEATRECFFIAEVAPNILFDTSLSYNFDFIEEFAGRFGAERVVFGTDLYSTPVGRRISHLLPQILESALSDADKQAILAGNARRLFGLDGD